ncbi:hypothetical protein OU798_24325 [Prolixibacteraceae bacterium Z1-6]|uniref:Uncharacterized protein n=1 Tax=Draconibacterium aestuarii TaxID=2998507 RepID=A0A9X3FHY6_9BACT|nr:hypothetical protein [Prolixibacteraceae bacterium Z1-6]
MKKLMNLIIVILLSGIITNCTDKLREDFEEIDFTKSAQLSEKPIVEYWFSDYMPLIPVLYGIKTYETTVGDEGERFTSKIVGNYTIPYTSGAITGVKIFWGRDDVELVFINDKRNLYFIAAQIEDESESIISTDCELTSFPPEAIIGKVYDGMIFEMFPEGETWEVNITEEPYECRLTGPTPDGGTNSGVTLVTIDDVHISGKRYNNAIILWELEPYFPFEELNFSGKEQELGLRLPTIEDTQDMAIDDFIIFGHRIGILATGNIGDEGTLDGLDELVSISHNFR